MSNALESTTSIKSQSPVYTPFPDAELTPIAPSDIAAAAEAALLAPAASDEVFELTGSERSPPGPRSGF